MRGGSPFSGDFFRSLLEFNPKSQKNCDQDLGEALGNRKNLKVVSQEWFFGKTDSSPASLAEVVINSQKRNWHLILFSIWTMILELFDETIR